MYEVVPRKLWIGNARDGRDARVLLANEIQCVVDLAMEEPPAQLPRELMYCRIPLSDGGGNSPPILHTALETVATLMRNGIPILVCCSGGMSRSPAIAAIVLSTFGERNALEWLSDMRRSNPVDVSPSLWNELADIMK
jgi:protein-tyrosine phosphatase